MAVKLAGRVTPAAAAVLIVLATMSLHAEAHIAAWAPGMYCVNVSNSFRFSPFQRHFGKLR